MERVSGRLKKNRKTFLTCILEGRGGEITKLAFIQRAATTGVVFLKGTLI